MSEVQGLPPPADVVTAFNRLGYDATFAAVAEKLNFVGVTSLYAEFPNREVLGELWLSECLPKDKAAGNVGALFGGCTFRLIGALNEQRDFSHAWLAAIRRSGKRLQNLERLHKSLHDRYVDWMREHNSLISLPEPLFFDEVVGDVADALCLITLRLVADWETDDSPGFVRTNKRVESTAYLLDGLLTSREIFGGRGLLVHMVDLLGVPTDQLLGPLLDLLRKPHRATRLAQLLALPRGKYVQPLLGLPNRAKHLVELLLRELQATEETLR